MKVKIPSPTSSQTCVTLSRQGEVHFRWKGQDSLTATCIYPLHLIWDHMPPHVFHPEAQSGLQPHPVQPLPLKFTPSFPSFSCFAHIFSSLPVTLQCSPCLRAKPLIDVTGGYYHEHKRAEVNHQPFLHPISTWKMSSSILKDKSLNQRLCSAGGSITQYHHHLRGSSKPGPDHHTCGGFLVGLKTKEIREHQVQPRIICVGFCLQFIASNITQFIAWWIHSCSAWRWWLDSSALPETAPWWLPHLHSLRLCPQVQGPKCCGAAVGRKTLPGGSCDIHCAPAP